uniref:C-X-C motif chemokine n=1 Tax=Pelusios castaneus TaxID=367368 RepID=A0A8C8SA36_9SAUR
MTCVHWTASTPHIHKTLCAVLRTTWEVKEFGIQKQDSGLNYIPAPITRPGTLRPTWGSVSISRSRPLPRPPMTGELRCQCLETTSEVIRPKSVVQVELIPEGPHCEVAEVIATTKHGKKVCLDPTAPWVKLIINKILNRYLHWGWD